MKMSEKRLDTILKKQRKEAARQIAALIDAMPEEFEGKKYIHSHRDLFIINANKKGG